MKLKEGPSKVIFLAGSVHVWSENPLFLGVWDVYSAQDYLIRLHFKARTQLLQLHVLVVFLFVDMVSEGNVVLIV